MQVIPPAQAPPKGPAARPRLLASPEGRAEGSDAGRHRAQPHTRQARQSVLHEPHVCAHEDGGRRDVPQGLKVGGKPRQRAGRAVVGVAPG